MVLTGRLPAYGPYYNISLRAASGKFDLQPEHDSCCSHVASARALDFCFAYEYEVLITAPDASPQPNYLENIAPLPRSPARRRCAGAPTCGAEQVTTGCEQVRNEHSSPTSFSALRRGKRSKEFPGLGFFNQTVPPSSAGSKRRKGGSSGGPTRRRRRHTASSYDSLRQGRCITALQAKARGQPSERAPHCALNPISSGGTGRRGGRRGKLRRRSARVTGKGGDLVFKIKALAQKCESVSGGKKGGKND